MREENYHPSMDGGKLRPSETSSRKHSGELDVEPHQEIKKRKGTSQRRRGTEQFVKMHITARAPFFPVFLSSRYRMLSGPHCYAKYLNTVTARRFRVESIRMVQ